MIIRFPLPFTVGPSLVITAVFLLLALSPLLSIKAQYSEETDSLTNIIVCTPLEATYRGGNPKPSGIQSYSSGFLDNDYQADGIDAFLDNMYENTHHHLETTGDFAQINPINVSFNGSSYKWTRHYLNGHRIDGFLLPGDALHKPWMQNSDLTIDPYNFTLKQDRKNKNYGLVEQNVGGIGGRVPWTDWFINNISNHESSFQRQALPITERKKMAHSTRAQMGYQYSIGEKNAYTEAQLYAGTRNHTGFNYDGISEYFPEDFTQLYLSQCIELSNYKKLNFYFSHLNRGHLNSEYFYNRKETAALNSNAFSGQYLNRRSALGFLSLGLNLTRRSIDKVEENFERNIIDQDAEGMEPWYPSSDVWELALHQYFRKNLSDGFSIVGEFYNASVRHTPQVSEFTHDIYYQPDADHRTELNRTFWSGQSFNSAILENSLGLDYSFDTNQGTQLNLGVFATLDGMVLRERTKIYANYDLNLGLHHELSDAFMIGVRLGRKRTPFDYDQVRFMSLDYLKGERYFIDKDGEQAGLFSTHGGVYRNYAEDLKAPYMLFADLPISLRAGSKWNFTLTPQYRSFRNLWTVEFDGRADLYGEAAVGESGRERFYLDGGITNYLVRNWNTDLMQQELDGNSSSFFNQPFYAGANFRLEYESDRFYMLGTLTANMIMGFGARGNGVLHNNINVLSESTANPNLFTNHVGRIDSDRSYMARFLMRYKWSDRFSTVIQLKYRDGQSFSVYYADPLTRNGRTQVAFTQPEVKGDNPFTGVMGTREDFFMDIQLRARYRFDIGGSALFLNAQAYNLMDFANNILEYNYAWRGEFNRYALDLSVPRGLQISAELQF